MFDHIAAWKGNHVPQPHPIPPSFSYKSGLICSVEYTLHAKLTRPPAWYVFSNNLQDWKTIVVKPKALQSLSTDQPPPFPQYHFQCREFGIQAAKLFSPSRKLSLSERAKETFNSSSQPHLKLRITLSVPKVLEASPVEPISFPFSATGLFIESLKACPPVLIFRQVDVWIRIHTGVRAGCHRFTDKTRLSLGSGSNLEIPVSAPDTQTEKAGLRHPSSQIGKDTVDLGKLLNIQSKPGQLIPGFSTYNIFRGYTIELRMHLECAGESMKCEFGGLPVEIRSEQTSIPAELPGVKQIWDTEEGEGGDNSLLGEVPNEELPGYRPRDELDESQVCS